MDGPYEGRSRRVVIEGPPYLRHQVRKRRVDDVRRRPEGLAEFGAIDDGRPPCDKKAEQGEGLGREMPTLAGAREFARALVQDEIAKSRNHGRPRGPVMETLYFPYVRSIIG